MSNDDVKGDSRVPNAPRPVVLLLYAIDHHAQRRYTMQASPHKRSHSSHESAINNDKLLKVVTVNNRILGLLNN